MSIRLRLIHEGKTSEYAFDRDRIALGRAPSNDLVIRSGAISPHHGALELEEEAWRFVDEGGQPSMVVRNGEVTEEIESGASGALGLEEGDFLILGDEVRIELLEVRAPRAAPRWQAHPLEASGDPAGAPPTELTGAWLSWSDQIAAEPGQLRPLLGALRQLGERELGCALDRVEVCIFTDSEEFLDDAWALERSGPQGEERFDVARAPLSRLGPAGAERARAEVAGGGSYVIADTERGAQRALYVGLMGGERCLGLVGLGGAHEEIEAGLASARVARAARALAVPAVLLRLSHKCAQGLAEENRYFRERERRHYLFKELICESGAMRRVYQRLDAWVALDAPVLVLGEAGSGKELMARALHHLGPRRDGMFISQHCGRMAGEVLGVELFGCVASELAGAVAPRKGIFELAHDGTVYLEEIDLLSPMLQGKLVRMLKEREVRRVGDPVGRRVDARLVASTHRDLREAAQVGRLRHDLYLLLKERILAVPPLRERAEDLMPLARTFLKKFARRYEKRVSRFDEELTGRMAEHDWPGNARELQSFIEAAVLKATDDDDALTLAHCHL